MLGKQDVWSEFIFFLIFKGVSNIGKYTHLKKNKDKKNLFITILTFHMYKNSTFSAGSLKTLIALSTRGISNILINLNTISERYQ